MFRKLRRRFTLVAAAVVFCVVFVILAVVNIVNYVDIVQDADNIISVIRDGGGQFESDKKGSDLSPETPFAIRYFTVTIDGDGEVSSYNLDRIVSVDVDTAIEMAVSLDEDSKTSGFYGDFRYGVLSLDGGSTMYIFIDCQMELNRFQSFMGASIVVGLVSILVVTVLIYFLSAYVLKPVSESYRKQKQFITDAGHEIKTPLTVIGADTELLEMDAGENEWTADIKDQIQKLSSLTSQLIYLAKMDEQTDLVKTTFDLSDTVDKAVQSFAAVAEVKGIELCRDIQADVSYTGNQESIARLVSVLIDNALKYTDGKTIDISLHTDGSKRIIQVSNPCSTMEDGNLDNLFERFVRGDPSRNSSTGGHGIGLSIAQAITEAHGGKIKAQAQGGVVYFTATL